MAESILVSPSVPLLKHDGPSDRCGTFTPEDDSPPVLVLGSEAETERIARLAARHGVDPLVLLHFARKGEQ